MQFCKRVIFFLTFLIQFLYLTKYVKLRCVAVYRDKQLVILQYSPKIDTRMKHLSWIRYFLTLCDIYDIYEIQDILDIRLICCHKTICFI